MARSLKTEQALLDALERLLAQKSFIDLTVSELATEAGLTTGAIYRRFANKEDVLRSAFQRFYDRSEALMQEHDAQYPETMTGRQVLEKYISDLMAFTLEHIHLMLAANSINDAQSFALMTKARAVSADWLAERLGASPHSAKELKHRCHFVLRVATATFRDTFLSGRGALSSEPKPSKGHKAEQKKLCDDLANMACDYLGI